MAGSAYHLWSVRFVTISNVILLLFVFPSYSTLRKAMSERHEHGFRVTLKHVDSLSGNLTKLERLQLGMKRGRQRLNALSVASPVVSQVHPGNGEFLMKLSIGTPPLTYSAIMDTGSDLIWTQCKPCTQCFDQPTPIFDPKKSSSFSYLSCSAANSLCEALPTSTCGKHGSCQYLYAYGDYSSTQGVLAKETFSFGKVSIPNIGFGCGKDNEGSGFTQGAGLVGLGRGPLSLVSQLKQPKFSYCLTSIDIDNDDHSESTSTLFVGSLATQNTSTSATTPLIRNPSQPSFYYLSLEGITVGDARLPVKKSTFALNNDGSGGLIIDSGTTITYLEQTAFDELKKEFISQINLPVDDSGSTGLDLCFTLPDAAKDVQVPKLLFHFEGADLDLPAQNYMIADSSMGVLCLAMGSSSGMSIFGNVQQQNLLVLHDLQKETISFTPTQCHRL